MQVDVRHRCLHVQPDPHRADHLQIGGLGVTGEGKNVCSGFEAAVVGAAGGPSDGGTCDGGSRVCRVIAKPARGAGEGGAVGEPADRMQIPGIVAGRWWPAGQVGPAGGIGDKHPHARERCVVAEDGVGAANASPISTTRERR